MGNRSQSKVANKQKMLRDVNYCMTSWRILSELTIIHAGFTHRARATRLQIAFARVLCALVSLGIIIITIIIIVVNIIIIYLRPGLARPCVIDRIFLKS